MLKRIGERSSASPDNREPVMPQLLCMVRHGESVGQVAQRRLRQNDSSAFTEKFRKTPSSQWWVTQRGFRQGLRTGDWMQQILAPSPLLPHGTFDRAYYSPYFACSAVARSDLAGVVAASTSQL